MPRRIENREWKGLIASATEIAAFAGVTRGQVSHWAAQEWFPEPLDEPSCGRVWDYQQVVAALSERGYPRTNGFRRHNVPAKRKP